MILEKQQLLSTSNYIIHTYTV